MLPGVVGNRLVIQPIAELTSEALTQRDDSQLNAECAVMSDSVMQLAFNCSCQWLLPAGQPVKINTSVSVGGS